MNGPQIIRALDSIRLGLGLGGGEGGEEHGGQGEAGDHDGQFDGGEGSVVKRAEDIGPDTVLIFLSAGPFNHSGGLAEAKKAAAEEGGILVGMGDGNVRPVGAAQLESLNWSKKKTPPAAETE